MSLQSEIFEQPQVLGRLLDNQTRQVAKIAEQITKHRVEYVFLAARGTSDNAGRYASYLWGAYNHLPFALATPSLFTLYQQPPQLKNALVVGISQSGRSPDIVEVLVEGKRQGCLTLAVTNAPDSPLAQAADFAIDIMAGHEGAVAATKTYTASLMAMAMLSVALGNDHERQRQLEHVPAWAEQALRLDEMLAVNSLRYRYMQRCAVIGRGFNYSTAFEWSLKLKELTYVVAEPYSSADFLHGPIAMVEKGFPIMGVAPQGKVLESLLPLLQQLRQEQAAEMALISDLPEVLELAQLPIQMPEGVPEWLTPMITIIPAQLFSYHLTRHKGLDTEAPRGLQKVTETH